MSNTVFIRTAPRDSAQKRHKYTMWNGKRMEKTKAKNAGTIFNPSPSRSKGMLNTGLWEQMNNPWYCETDEEIQNIEFPASWSSRQNEICKKKYITKQQWLEIKHGVKPGTYTSQKIPTVKNKDYVYTYLQDFNFPLQDGMTTLKLDRPKDEIMYHLALASSKVANDKNEIRPNVTEFYISDVNENEQEKVTKQDKIFDAAAKANRIVTELGEEELRKVCTILDIADHKAPKLNLKSALFDFIEEKTSKQMSNIVKFNEVYDMYSSPQEVERMDAIYLLKKLVAARVLSDKGQKYKWFSPPASNLEIIGKSDSEAIRFITDPDNIEWKEMMIEQYKAKTV